MLSVTFRALIGGACAWGLLASTGFAGARVEPRAGQPAPVAVVELFTSDACPSCPAAEAYLEELAQQARKTGQRIFPLAFHVDYWSPPGRKDPLSREQFAQRQRSYAESMGLEGAYTPQMIVNGTHEFVGSQRAKGQAALRTALAAPAAVQVRLAARQNRPGAGQPYRIEYETTGAPAETVINLALVESGVENKSSRGSKTQAHENIVRLFKTIPIRGSGRQSLQLSTPPDTVAANCTVVAYVQSTKNGAVLGAASTDLHPASDAQARMQPRE
jgi:hypothetical protein